MDWLTGNWHEMATRPWADIALAAVAILCGSLVGAERELKEKSAGLRTIILVCLGSSIFTQASLVLSSDRGDPGRVAAQIVTGIGFLGAGTILRSPGGIRGMTTAATIWAMAAVGMVVGSGYAGAGLALSSAVLLTLTGTLVFERKYLEPCAFTGARVAFEPDGGKARVRIEHILENYMIESGTYTTEALPGGLTQIRFSYCTAHKHHREFMSQLAGLPGVREIERTGAPPPLSRAR